MTKHAADLTIEELAEAGAAAAQRAADQAYAAGLTVSGTIEVFEYGAVVSKLAQRDPSGAITMLDAEANNASPLPRA
jgi:hypothetical protein